MMLKERRVEKARLLAGVWKLLLLLLLLLLELLSVVPRVPAGLVAESATVLLRMTKDSEP